MIWAGLDRIPRAYVDSKSARGKHPISSLLLTLLGAPNALSLRENSNCLLLRKQRSCLAMQISGRYVATAAVECLILNNVLLGVSGRGARSPGGRISSRANKREWSKSKVSKGPSPEVDCRWIIVFRGGNSTIGKSFATGKFLTVLDAR